MKAETEFVGGPLDGQFLAIEVGMMLGVPKTYKVPVPAHGDTPARTLVYVRSKQVHGTRWFWRYEYDEAATERASG
ncbi:hypothetical protein [Kitasatospora sp. NPDC093558]|uniref:hypothetical protein n=1 Tax=Kitasatospora sp. NPDC093558 TaxID=3155201 RepID=UPI00343166C7